MPTHAPMLIRRCLALVLVLIAAGCGGGSEDSGGEDTGSGSDSVCTDTGDNDEACISFSEDSQVIFDLVELWAQIDFWTSGGGGVIEDAWSPLLKIGVAPRSGQARWTFGQPPAGLRFQLAIWPQAAAQQMSFAIEDPDGLLAFSRIESPATTRPALVLGLRASLPRGSHSGEIRLHLCRDPACERAYKGSPVRLPVSVQVD